MPSSVAPFKEPIKAFFARWKRNTFLLHLLPCIHTFYHFFAGHKVFVRLKTVTLSCVFTWNKTPGLRGSFWCSCSSSTYCKLRFDSPSHLLKMFARNIVHLWHLRHSYIRQSPGHKTDRQTTGGLGENRPIGRSLYPERDSNQPKTNNITTRTRLPVICRSTIT